MARLLVPKLRDRLSDFKKNGLLFSPDCSENPFCKKDCNGKRENGLAIEPNVSLLIFQLSSERPLILKLLIKISDMTETFVKFVRITIVF
ncbi:MAG: hypothetical protein C0525_07505 [Flavobacterium sp.]|nr:hypothetical protein [Flavobacterium sp.]